jgi:hypothetical protein
VCTDAQCSFEVMLANYYNNYTESHRRESLDEVKGGRECVDGVGILGGRGESGCITEQHTLHSSQSTPPLPHPPCVPPASSYCNMHITLSQISISLTQSLIQHRSHSPSTTLSRLGMRVASQSSLGPGSSSVLFLLARDSPPSMCVGVRA